MTEQGTLKIMAQDVTAADAGPPAHSITPMEMLQIAVEKGADIEKLQQLMSLHERWEANQARKAFVQALTAFKAHPLTVVKNKKAGFDSKSGGARTEYEYATLAQVITAIVPALSENGLSHRWSTSQGEAGISVTCTLMHAMGHSESVTLSAPADASGAKNTIQAIGSTVSYLERYSLLAITGLAAVDQDDDAGGVVTLIDAAQKQELVDLIKEVNADSIKLCKYLGIDYIDMLPSTRFAQAKAALEKKRKPK
jgi:hypothetical protein